MLLNKPDLEETYEVARNWIIANKAKGSLSNWITLDDKNGVFARTGQPCHASMYNMPEILKGTPLVHGEKFCRWEKLGKSGQEFFKWLCNPETSLFKDWFNGGVELVDDGKNIIGALWKNMDAPNYIVTQWILGARCAGEHSRASSWDNLVQSGMSPRFAFWAMHFFSFSQDVFQRNRVGHVGIDHEYTIERVMKRDPDLKLRDRKFGIDRPAAVPFKEKYASMMYSNHIWEKGDRGFTELFPRKQMASGFGAIQVAGHDLTCMRDGAKKMEDTLNIPMFGE